jgi:hypothetical protein
MKRMIVGSLALSVGAMANAQLVTPGAKATLTVDYVYATTGSKPDRYDPRDWTVNRKVSIVTQLTADEPQSLSSLRKMEVGQIADQKEQQKRAASASQKMAPMAGDMMKIAEKCGEDEGCIERAVMAYSSGMQMTPELKSAGEDIKAASKQGPLRYQTWKPVSETVTWSVDEVYNAKNADPICENKPNRQCTRREIRKGGGTLPAAKGSVAMLEVDSEKKDLYIAALPQIIPGSMYTRVVSDDLPGRETGTSQVPFTGFGKMVKPFYTPLAAGLASVGGTQSIAPSGTEGEGGTVRVTWRFTLQK